MDGKSDRPFSYRQKLNVEAQKANDFICCLPELPFLCYKW